MESTNDEKENFSSANVNDNSGSSSANDKQCFWLNVLSFFIPVVGWILFVYLRKKTPIKAKGIFLWSWIGVAFWIVLRIIKWII